MRYLLTIFLMVAAPLLAKDKKPPEYTLKASVISTYPLQVSAPHEGNTQTTCAGDSSQVNCDSHTSHIGGETQLVSDLDLSDGNRYVVSCKQGIGAGFGSGFSRGAGNNITTGCQMLPGDYRARWDKNLLVLEVFNRDKSKSKEFKFNVISVRKQDTQKTNQ